MSILGVPSVGLLFTSFHPRLSVLRLYKLSSISKSAITDTHALLSEVRQLGCLGALSKVPTRYICYLNIFRIKDFLLIFVWRLQYTVRVSVIR